jgi:hypothetical protein
MANEIYADQLLHLIGRVAVESFATGVTGVERLGVRASDLETLIGEIAASPTANTVQDRLKTIASAIGTTNGKDFATQTTLAAILAKIIASPATEAKQDTGNTALTNIYNRLTTDPATQTGLTAVLDKLIAAPATEAKQDTANTHLSTLAGVDFATQTTLAAALMKLQSILSQLQGTGTGNLNISIEDAGITLPTDKQGILKTEVVYTATALGASASYTSSWIPVSTMRRLLILLNADQTGNLYVEHSRDGSAARRVTTVAVAANTPQGIEEICYSSYARVVYVNDATAQGSFELSVMTSAD